MSKLALEFLGKVLQTELLTSNTQTNLANILDDWRKNSSLLPMNQQISEISDKLPHNIGGYISLQDLEIDEQELLGKGAFGNVYCGKYKGNFVAVKSISEAKSFKNELKVLK